MWVQLAAIVTLLVALLVFAARHLPESFAWANSQAKQNQQNEAKVTVVGSPVVALPALPASLASLPKPAAAARTGLQAKQTPPILTSTHKKQQQNRHTSSFVTRAVVDCQDDGQGDLADEVTLLPKTLPKVVPKTLTKVVPIAVPKGSPVPYPAPIVAVIQDRTRTAVRLTLQTHQQQHDAVGEKKEAVFSAATLQRAMVLERSIATLETLVALFTVEHMDQLLATNTTVSANNVNSAKPSTASVHTVIRVLIKQQHRLLVDPSGSTESSCLKQLLVSNITNSTTQHPPPSSPPPPIGTAEAQVQATIQTVTHNSKQQQQQQQPPLVMESSKAAFTTEEEEEEGIKAAVATPAAAAAAVTMSALTMQTFMKRDALHRLLSGHSVQSLPIEYQALLPASVTPTSSLLSPQEDDGQFEVQDVSLADTEDEANVVPNSNLEEDVGSEDGDVAPAYLLAFKQELDRFKQ